MRTDTFLVFQCCKTVVADAEEDPAAAAFGAQGLGSPLVNDAESCEKAEISQDGKKNTRKSLGDLEERREEKLHARGRSCAARNLDALRAQPVRWSLGLVSNSDSSAPFPSENDREW